MQSPSDQQIIENCETLPMMGDWRLVVVQGLELLESGKQKGRLTTKEISDALEELDYDVEQVDKLYDTFEALT